MTFSFQLLAVSESIAYGLTQLSFFIVSADNQHWLWQ